MKKWYKIDSHRIISPKLTVKKVLQILKDTNIIKETNFKLKYIWDLDILKSYTYSIESNVWKRDNWWKGLTKYQALASAIMEFIERYSWYKIIDKINNKSWLFYKEINEDYIKIEDFILTKIDWEKLNKNKNYFLAKKHRFLKWKSLINNKEILIPWYEPEFMTTNSLWAWNTLEEAILHAIYELIERHNYNIMMANLLKPSLINLKTIKNENILSLIDNIQKKWFDVYLMDCSFYFNTNTIWALIYNKKYQFISHYSMNFHMWTHWNKDIAIIRALTEVIQNRAANLNNNKLKYKDFNWNWDIPKWNTFYIVEYYLNLIFNKKLEVKDYSKIKNYDNDDISIELNYIINEFKNNNFDLFVLDITDKKVAIPVVRVFSPKLQPMLFELFDNKNDKLSRHSNFIK